MLRMQASEFIQLGTEFEDDISNEAKFARSIDRLEPLLPNISNNGGTCKEVGVKCQTVYDKKKVIKNGSTELWKYAEQLIDESVEKGIFEK